MLEDAGYEAFAVGGCVRDCLMGKVPHDYDITTSALPEQMQEVFSSLHVIETGLQHGTLTVMLGKVGYEVTTYRSDGTYSDNRRPDSVQFGVPLREDLKRRDFTVNAMAYNPTRGLVDLFGGQDDLKNGIIRAVGDAEERFREDSLRILRAIRFSSVLDFDIAPQTAQAMHDCRQLLDNIAGERIFVELKKFLCGHRAADLLLEFWDVLAVIIPEIADMHGFEQHNPYHAYDVLEHTARVINALPQDCDIRLAALLHDSGKPSSFFLDEEGIGHFHGHAARSVRVCQRLWQRLHPDKATANKITLLVEMHDAPLETRPKAIARLAGRLGKEGFENLLDFRRADILAQNPDLVSRLSHVDDVEAVWRDMMEAQTPIGIGDLNISGNDLITLGMKPSPAMRQILERLLGMVIGGEVENEHDILLRRAEEIINNMNGGNNQ